MYALPMQNSDTVTFSVKFSIFKNFTSVTVFNIKSPNFQRLLAFTCSYYKVLTLDFCLTQEL